MKLRNIDPINLYYFRQLWHPPGNTFLEVITGVHIYKDMDIEQLVARLSKVFLKFFCLGSFNIYFQKLKILGNYLCFFFNKKKKPRNS